MNSQALEIKKIKQVYKSYLVLNVLSQRTEEALAERRPHDVMRTLNFIHTYLYDPRLTSAWITQECRITRKNFPGKFKHFVGRTPYNYYLFHRIETARKIFCCKKIQILSISEVTFSIGFNSHSAFTKAFKKAEKLSPSAFNQACV